MLTTFYVDANLALVADRDSSGGLSVGDQVTFGQGQTYEQANLTYDAAPTGGDTGTAFKSIGQALASPLVQAGDTIDIAGGNYAEDGVRITKSLTLQGLGDVILSYQPPPPSAPIGATWPNYVGITVTGNPTSVTLANVDIEGFTTSLSCDGCGTLTLRDMTLNSNPDYSYLPVGLSSNGPTSGISNVSELNLETTSSASRDVFLAPQSYSFLAPQSYSGRANISFFDGRDKIAIEGVSRLSLTTGAGEDHFNITPLAATAVTVNGGDPAPQGKGGDSLNLMLADATGAQLTVATDASGSFGSWTFSNRQSVVFKDIEALSPANVLNQAGAAFNFTEGVDSGSQAVARFVDPNGRGSLTDYSATIAWGDDSNPTTGVVSYDAATGLFSVSGSHLYAEDGAYTIIVTIHRNGHDDLIAVTNAVVAESPIQGISLRIAGSAGIPLSTKLDHHVVVARFTQGGSQEGFVNYADGDPNNPARIDWGDGTTTTGAVGWYAPYDAYPGEYSVSGAHTYSKPGHYTITVTVIDDGKQTVFTSTADIGDAFLPPGDQGTPNERFVAAIYSELLNRQIDFDGVKYWAARLDAGASRQEVVAGIQNSGEYRHDEINALFQTYLHRDADQGALGADNKLLLQGETLEQLAAIIVSSEEYFQQRGGGTNDGFLAALFQDAFDRQIDDGAKASFEQELSHGVTRAQIADQVFDSKEYRNIEVQNLYQQTLDRDVDQAGVAYWIDKLAHGMRDEQVLAAIMGSQEYFDKTQQ